MSALGGFSSYGLGLIAQGSPSSSAAQFLISSFNGIDNAPGGIGTFDVTGDSVTQSATTVTNNGQAYNMIIGPDGCVYAARGVAVFRITDTSGACTYAAANPSPSLYLAPIGISPNPAQGSTQNFTATFNYTTVPDGTPVLLSISGANPQVVQANTTGGVASFSYTGTHEGVDTLVASATVSGSPVTSNSSVVTWGGGTDVTFLTLNQSPTVGTAGQPVNLSANLTDVSVTPVGCARGSGSGTLVGERELFGGHRLQRQRIVPGHCQRRGERDAERELRRHRAIQPVERVGRLQRDCFGRIADSDRDSYCNGDAHSDSDGDADSGRRQAQGLAEDGWTSAMSKSDRTRPRT